MKARYGVTHNGRAHRDEVIAIGLAAVLGIIDERTPIYRRGPTKEEIEDPEILVLDVGGEHNPLLGNYDHHQLPPEAEECALSLLAKAHNVPREFIGKEEPDLTIHDLLKNVPWYRGVALQDSKGPAELARSVGLQGMPEELVSPFERFILTEIGNQKQVSGSWIAFTRDMVASKIRVAIGFDRAIPELEKNARFWTAGKADGKKILVVDVTPSLPFAVNEFVKRAGKFVAVTISRDPRTGGKVMYRLDASAVDFARLIGESDVIFAHSQGFMATVPCETTDQRLGELILKAMK